LNSDLTVLGFGGFYAEEAYVVESFFSEAKEPERKVSLLFLFGFDVIVDEIDFELLGELIIYVLVNNFVVLIRHYFLPRILFFSQIEAIYRV